MKKKINSITITRCKKLWYLVIITDDGSYKASYFKTYDEVIKKITPKK